jgi:SAM-dependent methyltransferase
VNRENNCPICGSTKKISVGRPRISKLAEEFIRKDYRVVMCNNCCFYFVDPEIDFTNDEWTRLYGEEYFGRQTAWHKKERLRNLKNRLDRIQQKSNNKIKDFLDVGCGEGFALIEANGRGWNASGIDIADNRILNAKNERVKFIKSSLLEAKFSPDSFDAVYMDSVLEHVINPFEYLKELYKILKPGGILYIGLPNEDSLFNDFRKLIFRLTEKNKISEKINPFVSPYHVVGFTRESLKIAAEKAAFEIINIRNFAARFEFRKYSAFSRGFWVHFLTLPVDLAAILLRKEVYLEAYLTK